MSGIIVPKSFACSTAVTILAGWLALGIILGLVQPAGHIGSSGNLRGGAVATETQPGSAAVAMTDGGHQLPDAASVEVGKHAARDLTEADSRPLDQGKPYSALVWPAQKQEAGFYDDWEPEEEERKHLKEARMVSGGLLKKQAAADVGGLMKAYSYKFDDFMNIEDHTSDVSKKQGAADIDGLMEAYSYKFDGFMEAYSYKLDGFMNIEDHTSDASKKQGAADVGGLMEAYSYKFDDFMNIEDHTPGASKQGAADIGGLMEAYSYKFDDFMNVEDHISDASGPMDGLMEFSYAL